MVQDFDRHELLSVQAEAISTIESNRVGRIDPLTAKSHTDHWLQELGLFVDSDIARGKVESAKEMLDFWLDRVEPDGRVPHMVLNTQGSGLLSIRRRVIDRRVQKAVKAENGDWVSPLQGAPVLSSVSLKIAEALPEDEAADWINSVLPRLDQVKRYHYDPNSDGNQDGLLVQRNQYEMLLPDGTVTEHVADNLKSGVVSRVESKTRDTFFQRSLSKLLFKARGDYDKDSPGGRKFDPNDTLSSKSASKLYPKFWRGKSEFQVQDVAMQAMLVADNEAHKKLYEISGSQLPDDLEYKFNQTNREFNELWDEEAGLFVSRNPETGELLTDHMGMEPMVALIGRSAMINRGRVLATLNAIEAQCYSDNLLPLNTGSLNIEDPGALDRGAMQPGMSYFVYEALDESEPREARLKRLIGQSIVGSCVENAVNGHSSFSRSFNSATGKSTGRNQAYWGPAVASVIKIANDLLNNPDLKSFPDR